MNFPFYISKRYLFSKKTTNTVNIISIISVICVTIGAMALIIVLSAFNGLDSLITSRYSSFDPDFKIEVKEGKNFILDSSTYNKIIQLNEVKSCTKVLEENVILKYDEQVYPARMKGVDSNFTHTSIIDSMMIDGEFLLKKQGINYAVMGQGLAYYLSYHMNFVNQVINVYVPRRTKKISLNPDKAISRGRVIPSGIFAIQQDYDEHIIVSLQFAREILEYKKAVSSIEVKTKEGINKTKTQKRIQEIVGESFHVKNHFQQHEDIFKVMKSEKLITALILLFIALIATMNIIGTLTMLIIEKKKDINTFKSMGANIQRIRKIFLLEGFMIVLIGVSLGLFLGAIVCILQQQLGFVGLPSSGSFIVNSYPIDMRLLDFINIFIITTFIGFAATFLTVKYIIKNYIVID